MKSTGWLGYNRPEWCLIWGCFAAWVVGYLVNGAAPMIVEALIANLGLSESRAAYLVSVEFAGVGLISLVFGPVIHRLSKRHFALLGCAIAIATNICSILTSHYEYLMFLRLLAGAGTGLAIVSGAAAVARYREPEKMFGVVNVLVAIVISIAIISAGYSLKAFGVQGIFGLMTMFYVLILPLLFLLPVDIHTNVDARSRQALPSFGLGCLFVFGFVFALIWQNACWVFGVYVGEISGLNIEFTGTVIGIAAFLGVIGAMLSAWIGVRLGRVVPLTVGFLAMGGSWWLMCILPNPVVFIVCMTVNNIAYFFNISFSLGMAASLDQWGRWASIAAGLTLLGSILGPVFAGLLIERGGIGLLGWTTLFGVFFALLLLLVVAQRMAKLEFQEILT